MNPTQPRTRTVEAAINERLAELESVLELGESFHFAHPADPKILDVADAVADPVLRERLVDSLDAIKRAENALVTPREVVRTDRPSADPLTRLGDTFSPRVRALLPPWIRRIWPEEPRDSRDIVGVPDVVRLGEYLARAAGRRVWPARINLSFDEHTVPFAPASAVESAAFRRRAVAAVDIAVRGLSRQFGRRLDGIWTLRQVDLRLSVSEATGTIVCRFVPYTPRPPRWRTAVDALHDALDRLPWVADPATYDAQMRDQLAGLGAAMISRRTLGPDELQERDAIHVPGARGFTRVLPRGSVEIEIYTE